MQARAGLETERANAVEAQVTSLTQEVQAKAGEVRDKQGVVDQAHRDLAGAQVSPCISTHYGYMSKIGRYTIVT